MKKEDIRFIYDPIQQEEIDLIKDVNKILIERPPTIEEIILKRFVRACFYQKKKRLIEELKEEKHIEIKPIKETIIVEVKQPEIKEVRIVPIPISTAAPPNISILETFAGGIKPEAKEVEKVPEIKAEKYVESALEGFQESLVEAEALTPKEVKPVLKVPVKPEILEEPPTPPFIEKFIDLVIDEEGKSIVKVRIVKDTLSGEMFYEVQEPFVDKNLYLYAIEKDLDPKHKKFEKYTEDYCRKLGLEFNEKVVEALRYHLFKYNSPFGPIDPLIHDSDIVLISSTIASPLIIKYRSGESMKTNLKIEQADYVSFIRNLGDLIGVKLTLKEPSFEGTYQNFKFVLNIGGIVKPSFSIERI
ncbi:hypothetical protein HY498_01915 [Candidatus Woesearchaeota archaeon]|nr:hypothetical protein [Candidatus Woesearchaeota archaeon]